MTTLVKFPDVAEVAASTPADRDRVLDVIRITSLVGVVLGHTVMAASIIRNHVLIWDNLLTTSMLFQALTWICCRSCRCSSSPARRPACPPGLPGTNWGGWLMKRCTRLFRPVFYYLDSGPSP